MFKKLAADALGLSDVGVIVAPGDYNKVDADDYLFHEDAEKILDRFAGRDYSAVFEKYIQARRLPEARLPES